MPKITLQMPRVASGTEPGPPATLSGPYIAWCLILFPDSDATTFVFAIHGLPEDASVEWSSTIGALDVVQGSSTKHAYVVSYYGGPGGTVTATVNGDVLGSTTYGAANVGSCLG